MKYLINIIKLCPKSTNIYEENKGKKNWSEKEFKKNILYKDYKIAKFFRETDPDFATLMTYENQEYFFEKNKSLDLFLTKKKLEEEKPKSLKSEEKIQMNEELKKIPIKKFYFKNDIYYGFQDIENMNCFNYLYFFPEVFKYHMSQDRFNYINIFDFILKKNNDPRRFNTREEFNVPFEKNKIDPLDFFNLSNIYLYDDEYKDSFERKLLKYETEFIKTIELKKFRNLSLGHTIIYTIDKLISSDVFNTDKYLNLICTGGVCNTRNFINMLNEDVQSLLTNNKDFNNENYIKIVNSKYNDYACSFYKGANIISKLPDLENIMISRQNYFDCGSDNLSFCYI